MALCLHGWERDCPECAPGVAGNKAWPGPAGVPANREPQVPLVGWAEFALPPFDTTPEDGAAIVLPRPGPGMALILVALSYQVVGQTVAAVHDFKIDLAPLNDDGLPSAVRPGYILSARPRRYFGIWMDGYDGFPIPTQGGAGRPYAPRVSVFSLVGQEKDFRVTVGWRPVDRRIPDAQPC